MKDLLQRQADAEIRLRAKDQRLIRDKYGSANIREKKVELCRKCQAEGCLLLPITTEGEDCPYFAPRASLSE